MLFAFFSASGKGIKNSKIQLELKKIQSKLDKLNQYRDYKLYTVCSLFSLYLITNVCIFKSFFIRFRCYETIKTITLPIHRSSFLVFNFSIFYF